MDRSNVSIRLDRSNVSPASFEELRVSLPRSSREKESGSPKGYNPIKELFFMNKKTDDGLLDVTMKKMEGKEIDVATAAVILGVTERQVYRLKKPIAVDDYDYDAEKQCNPEGNEFIASHRVDPAELINYRREHISAWNYNSFQRYVDRELDCINGNC